MIRFALTISIETYKKFSQLDWTSNKRSSSGEMKKDQKRVDIYREMDLTPILIKDDLWRLIFMPLGEVDWSMISVTFRCVETSTIKSDMCECVLTPYRGVVAKEGMTLLNSYWGDKELWPHFEFDKRQCQSNWIDFWPYRPWWNVWVYIETHWSKSPNIVKLG